jgi:hypothetical protein
VKYRKASANQEQILYDELLRRLMGLLFLYHGGSPSLGISLS